MCFRSWGGSLMNPFESVRRESKAVDYFHETGNVEIFDAQKAAATMARRDRVTSVEHVWHD